MFERYTEKARRVIFFARYEASQFGDVEINDAHLLLGLLREDSPVILRFLAWPGEKVQHTVEDIRRKVEEAIGSRKAAVSTSVDMPLSAAGKRILAYSAEEAESLNQRHIGTEHLLLGMLREKGCLAASVLQSIGIELAKARELIATSEVKVVEPHISGSMGSGQVRVFAGGGTRHAGILEFVCDGKVIASVAVQAVSPIPRAGERVAFKNKEGSEESYRVEEVQYGYERFPPDMLVAPHRLAKVVVQLQRE